MVSFVGMNQGGAVDLHLPFAFVFGFEIKRGLSVFCQICRNKASGSEMILQCKSRMLGAEIGGGLLTLTRPSSPLRRRRGGEIRLVLRFARHFDVGVWPI